MESPGSATTGILDTCDEFSSCLASTKMHRQVARVLRLETTIGEFSISSNMKYGPEPFVPCRSRLNMASYKGPVQVSMIAHSLGRTTRSCPVRLNCLRNSSTFEFSYENTHIRGTRLRWIFLNPGSASCVAPSCDDCQIRVPRRVSYC
jgi:hypothetical protein